MIEKELNDRYFEWMCQLVDDRQNYKKLLKHLNLIEFIYIHPMDENRAEDGIYLRYRFSHDSGYSKELIDRYLMDQPCSVLEMMVALALRCEENIMSDPDLGNRTGYWFWGMVNNLGLNKMDNFNFSEEYVNEVILRFMNRQYKKNGEGGLFTIRDTNRDMRDAEIWYQLNWYLNDIS